MQECRCDKDTMAWAGLTGSIFTRAQSPSGADMIDFLKPSHELSCPTVIGPLLRQERMNSCEGPRVSPVLLQPKKARSTV